MLDLKWPTEDNKIPRELYTNDDVYQLEMERIFKGPVWVLLGHEAEIPSIGDYKTMDMGDVPVIVIRNKDNEIKCLVNACAHRGARVAEGPFGNAIREGLRCIYHMWTYDTDGCLIGVSLPEDFPPNFHRKDYGLPHARVETYKGLIFASFSEEAPPLMEYLAELTRGLDVVVGDGELRYLGIIRVLFQCNWKLYIENIYDGYHVTTLHTGFQLLRLRSQGGERQVPNYEKIGHVWSQSRSLPPQKAILRDMSILDVRTKPEPKHNIMVVFPTGVVTDYLDTIQLRYVIPRGVNRCEVQFTYFARKDDSEDVVLHRARQGSQVLGPEGCITLEDAVALERVQLSSTARGENVILKGAAKRFPPYRHVDEAPIRFFYNAYRRLMKF